MATINTFIKYVYKVACLDVFFIKVCDDISQNCCNDDLSVSERCNLDKNCWSSKKCELEYLKYKICINAS